MSLRLTLLNTIARLFLKHAIARAPDPTPLRPMFERDAALFFRAPPHSLVLDHPLGRRPALLISNRPATRPPRPRKALFYIHGGGFVAGSPRTHSSMLARLARLTQTEVFATSYRLAPEAPFPAASDDVRVAYDALLAKGYRPTDIILGGDSAGGNLALSLLAELCGEGTPPAALFAFSPLTDFTFSGRSITENARSDTMLPITRRDDLIGYYLAGHPANDPRVSPLFATFPGAPPAFLQFSDSEVLRDDSRRMAEKLRASGSAVTTDEWRATPHVWAIFDGWIPEARAALERAAAFITETWEAQATAEVSGPAPAAETRPESR